MDRISLREALKLLLELMPLDNLGSPVQTETVDPFSVLADPVFGENAASLLVQERKTRPISRPSTGLSAHDKSMLRASAGKNNLRFQAGKRGR